MPDTPRPDINTYVGLDLNDTAELVIVKKELEAVKKELEAMRAKMRAWGIDNLKE